MKVFSEFFEIFEKNKNPKLRKAIEMSEETTQSNLLRCYRKIGYIAGDRRANHFVVDKKSFMVVPTGNSFMEYDITRKI